MTQHERAIQLAKLESIYNDAVAKSGKDSATASLALITIKAVIITLYI